MDNADYAAPVPDVELIQEEPPRPTLHSVVFGVYLKGTRIGDVGRSRFDETEWEASLNLDTSDSVNIRFQYISGKGETPEEAITQALLKGDADLKQALNATRTLSFVVLGTMREEYRPWSAKRKRNQLQFADFLNVRT
jgi:hypothetical protein